MVKKERLLWSILRSLGCLQKTYIFRERCRFSPVPYLPMKAACFYCLVFGTLTNILLYCGSLSLLDYWAQSEGHEWTP